MNSIWFWIGLFILTYIIAMDAKNIAEYLNAPWLTKYPKDWIFPTKTYISSFMNWLIEDASFGLFTFTEFTRAISWTIEQPYKFVLALLSSGFTSGFGKNIVQILPPLSWLGVLAFVIALAHYAKSWFLAFIVGLSFLYLAVFGQWDSAMITLASVVIAVPIGVGLGLMFGIYAYYHPLFEKILNAILDLMQTIPIFAYLVPILFMFGFGPVSALIATVIYAAPPMVRNTMLALKSVDPEIKDFGIMTGCTRFQLTWRILVPASLNQIMVGTNQVIMLSLNMVIIASMIGAGGLGFDVLSSLRRLDIGGGFEAGIAIVILAIAIDRLSQAFAVRQVQINKKHKDYGVLSRYKRTFIVIGILLSALIFGQFLPFLQDFPKAYELSTGTFWSDLIKYLNINYFDYFEAVKIFLLKGFMLPIKRFLLSVPWGWMILILTILGWKFGGWKLALLNLLMSLFIVINGVWDKAMITIYLCGASVIIAAAIGLPLGILAAVNDKAGKIIGVFIDTLQTLPSFVYLIPVVMLFRIGDFTAMIAIILYALVPAVRYTAHGVKNTNPELIEAGIVSGATKWQTLTKIRLPLALPEILLGINQTIMLALSMLVITALVGTRDLGQEVYIALTKADTGRGLVAGLAIAFIAIMADRIISAGAKKARIRYGMEAE
ncbi:MAG: ABC transporter permease subunit [Alphaproteobacteria bacterium]|nr:ABC transporter permease subunit [Alphaproteobacteria bacterium]